MKGQGASKSPDSTTSVKSPLSKIPAILSKDGRVKGFEALRDMLLSDWEGFMAKGLNAYSAIKLVLETDRHAMFAELQMQKSKGVDESKYEHFQKYLEGDVELDEPEQPKTTKAPKGNRKRARSVDYAAIDEMLDDAANDSLFKDTEEEDNGEEESLGVPAGVSSDASDGEES